MTTTKAKKVFRFSTKNTNTKLGAIPAFSIDRRRGCPGKSQVCWEICYGGTNRQAWQSSRIALLLNYIGTRSANFAANMIASLDGLHPVAFRIHDLGDFYSAIYVRKWIKIVRARRDIKFWAYTRSWRLPAVAPELRRLAAEPNMTIWLSLDNSMPCDRIPSELAYLPRAWLATTDDDIPPPHLHVDLVFRKLQPKMPRLDDLNHFGAQVCPAETGHGKTTCDKCKICCSRGSAQPQPRKVKNHAQ